MADRRILAGVVRRAATKDKIERLIRELGKRAKGPGKVYLVGGSSIVLMNAGRESTVDVDLILDPEPTGIFEAIAELKDVLDLNIELAAPDQFIPALPGWRERCLFIEKIGEVEFLHYDFYAQALAKLERGHERDLRDVVRMVDCELVDRKGLLDLFREIEPELIRYPAIDIQNFRRTVRETCGST